MASTVEAKNAAGTALGRDPALDRRQELGRARRALGRRLRTPRPARSRRGWPSPRPRWSTRPWRRPRRPPSRSGARPRSPRAPASCSRSASCVEKHKHELAADPHPRARQGRCRRAGRGEPRPRGGRVRLRHAAAPEGRVLRERLDRRRQLLDPPAARRRRRHHAVQLPGDGADVDVPDRDRLREHLHPQAVREGPVGRELLRAAARRRRPARRASSTSSTATRSRSTRSSSTPGSRR